MLVTTEKKILKVEKKVLLGDLAKVHLFYSTALGVRTFPWFFLYFSFILLTDLQMSKWHHPLLSAHSLFVGRIWNGAVKQVWLCDDPLGPVCLLLVRDVAGGSAAALSHLRPVCFFYRSSGFWLMFGLCCCTIQHCTTYTVDLTDYTYYC